MHPLAHEHSAPLHSAPLPAPVNSCAPSLAEATAEHFELTLKAEVALLKASILNSKTVAFEHAEAMAPFLNTLESVIGGRFECALLDYDSSA